MNRTTIAQCLACLIGGSVIGLAVAQTAKPQTPPAESERQVTEAEVPKAALDALKKLAAGLPERYHFMCSGSCRIYAKTYQPNIG